MGIARFVERGNGSSSFCLVLMNFVKRVASFLCRYVKVE